MTNKREPEIYHTLVNTPMGWVGILVTDKGVRHLTLPQTTPEEALEILTLAEGTIGPYREDAWPDLASRLQAFYAGKAVTFDDIPLDMEGRPPFFQQVWKALRHLPRGETITYGELAAQVGHPKAMRAVGQAMARNPYPPIVPCHRVIGKGEKLTGFGGGLNMKQRLLAYEREREERVAHRN